MDTMDPFELTDVHSLHIVTDNAASKYWMTWKLESTLEASGIGWSAMRTHIARMAHIIQLGLGVFITNLGKQAA
jgi:hypothetical protein